MKKYGSLIALAVVVILAVVIMTTRKEPVTEVKAPYSIEKVENLGRIEITQAGDAGGLVVLTKVDENWTLTKPVEAPLAQRMKDQLTETVKGTIRTDDVKLDATKLDDFELGEDKAAKVAFFAKGSEAAATEFWVGKTFTVEGTRAKRTYIKTTDGKVFRAQSDIGEVLGRPVDQLRSRDVQKLDRASVKEIIVNHQDGTRLKLAKVQDRWDLLEPKVDFELEKSAVSSLANGASNLVATGFVDDKQPADVGLDPWHVKVSARDQAGELHSILVSNKIDGKAYAKTDSGTHIYEIAERQHDQLAATPLSLRGRLVKNLNYSEVQRIDFLDGVSVKRIDAATFEFAKGGKGKVAESKLNSKLTSFVQLRAVRFEQPDESVDTGLGKTASRITLTMKNGDKHVLLIGGDADAKGNLWARWEDLDLVMVVPQWVRERGAPKASDLADDAS
jgi:hypothetical protein